MQHFRNLIQHLLGFVFPSGCQTCDGELQEGDAWVCRNCWDGMDKVQGAVRDGVIEYDCIDEIRSALYYDKKLQTLIHSFKYHRALSLSERFAEVLSVIIKENVCWSRADYLIPVPMHKVKLRERTYNQSEEIARALSDRVSIPCRSDILTRSVNTVSQTQMSDAKERVRNMKEVFEIKHRNVLNSKTVILVDDLITTGSTANACARTLKEGGCSKVYVLTVGRPYF